MKILFSRKLVPFLIATMLLCGGCWDRKEFNQLAIAQSIAIDYEDDKYQLTVQLVMPAASDAEISGDSMWIIKGTGKSVAEALEQISRSAPRELYLNHLDIVLLGEGLLKKHTGQGMAYLIQEDVLRRRTNILAVEGSAGKLLQAKLELADVDIYYLRNLLRDQRQWVKGGDTIINDYMLATAGQLSEGLMIPRIEVKEDQALALNGAALLRNNRLLGWIEQNELDSYRWITGGAEICTLPETRTHESMNIEIRKQGCKWKLVSQNPLKVQAELQGILIITENNISSQERNLAERQKFYQQIQKETEELLKKQIKKDFQMLQQHECDCLRLGRWLYAWHPDLVQKENWAEQFSELQIDIKIKTRVQSEA